MARKYMKIAMVGQKRVQAHGGAGAFRDVL